MGVKMLKRTIAISVLAVYLALTAFQCASTEMTTAKLYIQQKNPDKALEALEKEVAKNPKNDEAYFLMGNIYGEKAEYEKMLEAYDKSLAISKKFEANINNNKYKFWADNYQKGAAYFNLGIKANDQDTAKIFYNKALEAFNTAIKILPDTPSAYQSAAYVYLNLGQIDKSVEPLETVYKRQPKNLQVIKILGEVYLAIAEKVENNDEKNKIYEKALSMLHEAKKNFPNDQEILIELSNVYIQANRVNEALEIFAENVKLDPNNKSFRYNYGVVLLNAKKYAEAEEQFKKALEIDPEFINATYNLAVTYIKWAAEIREKAETEQKKDDTYKEKYAAAEPLLKKYLEKNPKNPELWNLLGKIYANLGRNQESMEAFKKADELR